MENKSAPPLADRMRPRSLAEFFGQEELVGEGRFLRAAIESGRVPSLIFWGPPGSGKTTLARIIAAKTGADFIALSAVMSGIKELRESLARAEENARLGMKTLLFVDEIHRWNKSQQDALLPHVEGGLITLIGATTENPSFEINNALISRSRVLVLQPLSREHVRAILQSALEDAERGLGGAVKVEENALELIADRANGDARMALGTLEVCAAHSHAITSALVKEVLQKTHLLYDRAGEEHYNLISALHKSLRGGDGNAALYWLARMLEGGEDPLYIARRLLRFASEDVGVADHFAVVLAESVFEACHKMGSPECDVHLAQLVMYLAHAKKSIAAYQAIGKAKEDAREWGNLPVPLHLRNAPTKLMKELDYGKGYKYTPLEDSVNQTYLPDELKDRRYY